MISFSKIHQALGRQDYHIGFILESALDESDSIYDSVSWMDLGHYHKGWFADPFILTVEDDYVIVLAEEWVYKDQKGRISKLTVSKKDFKLIQVKPILELATHLSFPNIIRKNGKTFIYPENSQSGRLSIYEYDDKREELHSPRVLINEPLVDSQIVEINNSFYLFGTKYCTGALIETKHQNIYKSDSLFGPYVLIQTLSSDKCNERGAGEIFHKDSTLIRPCQDCEHIYGKAVIFKRLVLENGVFEEITDGLLESDPSKRNGQSLHTFNKKEGICVIDGTDYHFRLLANCYKHIFK